MFTVDELNTGMLCFRMIWVCENEFWCACVIDEISEEFNLARLPGNNQCCQQAIWQSQTKTNLLLVVHLKLECNELNSSFKIMLRKDKPNSNLEWTYEPGST